MADLFSILNNGATGLAAHQAAVATASNNIQNVNTPGYARQRAELEAVSPAELSGGAYVGRGVALQTVSQARDVFIERQMPGAAAAQARSTAQSDALAGVTALDPDGAGSLTDAIGAFYDSMRALAQNAGDPGLRQAVVGATRALGLAFNGASTALEAARTGLDAKAAGTMSDVNQAAATVARLNTAISVARAGGAEPNDLLDARQLAANKLSELTGAAQIPTGQGDLQMILPGGGALVSGGRAGTLSVVGDASNGGHLAFRLAKPDGSSPASIATAAVGGALGGLVDARDGALKTAETSLDQLAYDLTGTTNAVHAAGVGLDGVGGRSLFVAQAAVGGAAARMAIDPGVASDPRTFAAATSAASLPGDARNLQALIATESTPLSGGQSAPSALSSIVTSFGASAATARGVSTQDSNLLASLQAQRDSVSSVSIDEEMVNLTKSQRAYEAVAKVITTANQMLDTLMTIAGG